MAMCQVMLLLTGFLIIIAPFNEKMLKMEYRRYLSPSLLSSSHFLNRLCQSFERHRALGFMNVLRGFDIVKIMPLFFTIFSLSTSQQSNAQIQYPACDLFNAMPVAVPGCNQNNWHLVFSDEFNGVAIDPSKWIIREGLIRNPNDELQCYRKENVDVSNGSLHLIARKEDFIGHNYLTAQNQLFHYTSGEVDTRHQYGNGMWEVGVKIPSGLGSFWPAFWLYGQTETGFQNEIDVFEYWDNLSCTWHMNTHVGQGPDDVHTCPTTYSACPGVYDRFNLTWDFYGITWKRNDAIRTFMPRYFTVLGQPLSCGSVHPFHNYLQVPSDVYPSLPSLTAILNLAIKGGENIFDDAFPASMDVDYIRFWQKLQCQGDLFVHSVEGLDLESLYNVRIGSSFTFVGNTNLHLPNQIEFVASDFILIEDNFIATGSPIIFRIDENTCNGPSELVLNQNSNTDYALDSITIRSSELYYADSVFINKKILPVMYPNPCYNNLTIEATNDDYEKNNSYSVSLFDYSGRMVARMDNVNFPITIPMVGYLPGLYCVILQNKLGSYSAVIQKQ